MHLTGVIDVDLVVVVVDTGGRIRRVKEMGDVGGFGGALTVGVRVGGGGRRVEVGNRVPEDGGRGKIGGAR